MAETIEFTLNGKPTRIASDGQRPLLAVLRDNLGLTGTKFGCGTGQCGACTVLTAARGDGAKPVAIRSCQTPVRSVQGRAVTTIEGLAREGRLHPVQEAFIEHEAMQCGYCTSGVILSTVALLARKPNPTEADIREGLNGNLCRCGSHRRIILAVRAAAQKAAT